eukprot:m.24302 g.24302  ORF g.24302 m.24302 type:complete len:428 (-) comp6057_c0_seq1:127-1410(-)
MVQPHSAGDGAALQGDMPGDKDQSGRAVLRGDLAAPDPIPQAGVDAAVALLQDGRLFRYGESAAGLPEAAVLEEEFARYVGRKCCLGVNSGGCALYLALKAAGVELGDPVLVNAFTLAPVPGAIDHAGGRAVLVDINERLVVDLDDLDRKAAASGARFFLLSYMRGHIPDMTAVMALCNRRGICVIEDCAHTMGASWDGQLTGTFGAVGCYSTQTFKHINSGEGGLLVTNDDDIAAKAILRSGSYMLYAQHRARPPRAAFDHHRGATPNNSMRMSGLAAAILRPQLALLDARNRRWQHQYSVLAPLIDAIPHLRMPIRPAKEGFVPSSLQFFVDSLSPERIQRFAADAGAHGALVKWFGVSDPVGFTSRHVHWEYLTSSSAAVPTADRILARLCDLRLPLWLEDSDCATLATVLREAMAATTAVARL